MFLNIVPGDGSTFESNFSNDTTLCEQAHYGAWARMLEDDQRALQLRPLHKGALGYLGELYLKTGREVLAHEPLEAPVPRLRAAMRATPGAGRQAVGEEGVDRLVANPAIHGAAQDPIANWPDTRSGVAHRCTVDMGRQVVTRNEQPIMAARPGHAQGRSRR